MRAIRVGEFSERIVGNPDAFAISALGRSAIALGRCLRVDLAFT